MHDDHGHPHDDHHHDHPHDEHAHAHPHSHGDHSHAHSHSHSHSHSHGDHAHVHGDHSHSHSHGDHAHSHSHGDHAHSHSHSHAHGDHAHHHHPIVAAASGPDAGDALLAVPTHVAAYVVTCSGIVHDGSDQSGKRLRALLEDEGHSVVGQEVIPDEALAISAALVRAQKSGARAVFLVGGTGLSSQDVTISVLEKAYDKAIPGFGELLRALAFSELGAGAMRLGASAGVSRGQLLVALPSTPAAVKLAMQRLILPELGSLVRELSR